MHTTGKCNKLTHALAKSAKLSWGLNHEALNTIYKGAIFASYAVRRADMDRDNGKEVQQNSI